MGKPDNTQGDRGIVGELLGAVADSFARDRTARLLRLEGRLFLLRRWVLVVLAMAFVHFAYQLWGEVAAEYQALEERAAGVAAADAGDGARSSLFLIFAAALLGPLALFGAYLVLGFLYNVIYDALLKHVPLVRFLLFPLLLLFLLLSLGSRHDSLKQYTLDGYALAEHHIAAAKSLRQQARAAGEQVRELRGLEAQWQEPGNGMAGDGHSEHFVATAPDEAIAQDEAVRRLGELMLQLQGLSLQQPPATSEPVAEPQTYQGPQQPAQAAPAETTLPSPAAPADI